MEKIKLLISAKSIPVHRKDLLNGTCIDTHENNKSCDLSGRKEGESRKDTKKKKPETLGKSNEEDDAFQFTINKKTRDRSFGQTRKDSRTSASPRPAKIGQMRKTINNFGLSPVDPIQTYKIEPKDPQLFAQGYFTLKVNSFRIKNKTRHESKTSRNSYDIQIDSSRKRGIFGSQISSHSPMNKKIWQNG